jgi:N-acetyl-anhydromuramyl-L-alanine amidase AmpD
VAIGSIDRLMQWGPRRRFRLRYLLLLALVAGALFALGRHAWREWRWRYIVIHHTASDAGNLEYYRRLHKEERGWPDIAYHFVINNGAANTVPGQVEESDLWKDRRSGYSTRNTYINTVGIAIVMVGNLDRHPPLALQYQALVSLLVNLSREYRIPPERIIGHRELQQTKCPGQYLNMAKLREDVARELAR